MPHILNHGFAVRQSWTRPSSRSSPYLVLSHGPSGRTFATLRTGGDDRLVGQASLGLGGHMDEGETFEGCLCREIMEEVGLARDDIQNLTLCGYIFSNASEVDSVHVGMVYRAERTRRR